jgi:hypothetical protein
MLLLREHFLVLKIRFIFVILCFGREPKYNPKYEEMRERTKK